MTRAALTWCAAVLLYVGGGVAHGLRHPPPPRDRCPSYEECWTLEMWCDHHSSRRELYECRRWVAVNCMGKAERCRGGWSY